VDALTRLRRNVRRLQAELEITTQVELATRAKLGTSTVNGLLTGGRAVRFSTLDKIADALQVDVSELFAQPPGDQLRHTSQVQNVDTDTGRHDAQERPTVRAIRAIIREMPDEAAEAIAALVERGQPSTPQPNKPARDRTTERSRQRPPKARS
jgi:transcriptional regulator with XRE-family HTH domain